jgi:hypothetical protein
MWAGYCSRGMPSLCFRLLDKYFYSDDEGGEKVTPNQKANAYICFYSIVDYRRKQRSGGEGAYQKLVIIKNVAQEPRILIFFDYRPSIKPFFQTSFFAYCLDLTFDHLSDACER